MKRIALVAALGALVGLSACTTVHPDRRTLLDWNLELVKQHAKKWQNPKGEGGWDGTFDVVAGWVLVEPVAVAMVPITWAGDTFVLNVIDGYKKAEMDNHAMRFGGDDNRTNAHSAVHAYGPLPTVTPWWVSDLLSTPRFAAEWLWNSTYPTRPHCPCRYNAYWNKHNEVTSQ